MATPCQLSEKIIKFMCTNSAGDGAGDLAGLDTHTKWVRSRIFPAFRKVHMEIWLVLCERVIDPKGGATGRVD